MVMSPSGFMDLIKSSMQSNGLVVDLDYHTNRSYKLLPNAELIPEGSIDVIDGKLSGEYIAISVAGTIDNSRGVIIYGTKFGCMSNLDKKMIRDESLHCIVQYESTDGKEVYVTAFFDIHNGLTEYVAVSDAGKKMLPDHESISKTDLGDSVRELFLQIRESIFGTREEPED